MEVLKKIGSHDDNDIVIKNKNVAAFHAELRMTVGWHCYITDLNSPQGTFINNEQLEGTQKLRTSDLICFGDHNFYWEEHYPDFLDRNGQAPAQPKGDFLLDEFEDELADHLTAGEEERGLSWIKKGLFNLRNPIDRQALNRRWMLVLSLIMLISISLPQFSWGLKNLAYTGFSGNDPEPFSGFQFIAEILDKQFDSFTMLEVFSHLMLVFTILIVAISAVYFLLIGLKLVKPKSHLTVKGLSIAVIICYGIIALNQLLDYLRFGFSDNFSFQFQKSDVSIENLGIGFWLCLIASILVFKSVKNGLWQQSYSRKWVTLSFSFWIPVLILIVFVHGSVGVIVQKIDNEAFEKQFSNAEFNGNDSSFEASPRIPQSGPLLITSTNYFVMSQLKHDQPRNVTASATLESSRQYMQWTWFFIHLFFLTLLLLIFMKKVFSNYSLILSILLAVFALGLTLSLNSLIGLNQNSSSKIITTHLGWALYIALAGVIGILVEQVVTRKKLRPIR